MSQQCGGHRSLRPRNSSVLFQSIDKGIVVIDIPRSLEEAQRLITSPEQLPLRRIYSDTPPSEPFLTPERRSGDRSVNGGAAHDWATQCPAAQIADLMTAAAVQSALDVLHAEYNGPLYLPRVSSQKTQDESGPKEALSPGTLWPPGASYLDGSIKDQRQVFIDTAPVFNLVVLDPPWPNRSARRRADKYSTVNSLSEMRDLLTSIPISTHLANDGLVAVWITNKSGIPEFLTSPSGVFAAWGVELAAEWTWVKITALGEPLYPIDSAWRKPWEKLLIAKRIGLPMPPALGPKVVIAAPDIHSRKPSLCGLFRDILGKDDYAGLEIFARNLTAGWWSWGNEVLRYQDPRHWEPLPGEGDASQV